MNTPVILSYFSQSSNPGDPHLKYLQDEYTGIAEAWEKFQVTGSDQYVNAHFPARGNSDSDAISKDIRAYKNRIVVFHFSGHAGSDRLIFKDGAAYADGLASLLGEAKNLRVVILNGCATHDQVQLLLKKGIYAVIATRGKVQDGLAMRFGLTFHQALSTKGYGIEEAFKHAVQSLAVSGNIASHQFSVTSTTVFSSALKSLMVHFLGQAWVIFQDLTGSPFSFRRYTITVVGVIDIFSKASWHHFTTFESLSIPRRSTRSE